MNTVFPPAKIKTQILRDEDNNIGRVTSRAVELIAACSALLVRDLVDNSNGDNNNCHHQTRITTARTSPETTTSSCNKRKCPDETKSSNGTLHPTSDIDDEGPSSSSSDTMIRNLNDIKKQTKRRPEYKFILDNGTLDKLTENNAHKYDAAARTAARKKREREKRAKQHPKGSAEAGGGDTNKFKPVAVVRKDNLPRNDDNDAGVVGSIIKKIQ
mmetsp:Transcript_36605/g.64169  ORF Transcript_36605/g.64169 Transcript_36605/m.64169 type:complete len:214 (+) Transcript_36605:47-688(+)